LRKERGFAEEPEGVGDTFSDGELFAVEPRGDGGIESALVPEREPKTRQKDISSPASLSQLVLRKLRHRTSNDPPDFLSVTMPSIP